MTYFTKVKRKYFGPKSFYGVLAAEVCMETLDGNWFWGPEL